MRKIIFRGNGPTVGMSYEDDVTQITLDNDAWQYAVDNAEMFGYQITEDEIDEENEDWAITGDQIDGYWEDYDAEKHEGHRAGGGSFEDDFDAQN